MQPDAPTSGRVADAIGRRSSTSSPRFSKPLVLRASPSERALDLWRRIVKYLEEEWSTVRSLNLGVKSGTGVVDELLIRKVHTWVQQLHVLVITHETVADAVGKAARQLSTEQLSQMQVMLDVTDYEHLADFLRLSVYNVTSPFAKKAVDVITDKQLRAARRKREEAKRARAAAAAMSPPHPGSLTPQYTGPRPGREEYVRFCGYLPSDHPLVQQAYRLWLARMPPDPEMPEEVEGAAGMLGDAGSSGRLGRRRYGTAMSLADERQAMEAARNRPPELQLWTDVERRWQQTCHTTHRHELLNPLMVSAAVPLYASMPDFKRKVLEAEALAAPPVVLGQNSLGGALTSRRTMNGAHATSHASHATSMHGGQATSMHGGQATSMHAAHAHTSSARQPSPHGMPAALPGSPFAATTSPGPPLTPGGELVGHRGILSPSHAQGSVTQTRSAGNRGLTFEGESEGRESRLSQATR